MLIRRTLLAGCITLALVAATAGPGDAQSSFHQTASLTFAKTVALPGVALPAGTYTFELASPWSNRYTVVVRSGDGQRLHYLGHTRLVARPLHMREGSGVLLGEARPGTPPPVTMWYPPSDSDGREFVYR